MNTRADEAMEKTGCPTADDYDDYDDYEKTGRTIWVSNSCGELFIFNNVPDDGNPWWDISPATWDQVGISHQADWWPWWRDNNISDVVGNDKNACEWGAFHKITRIQTPPGGWKETSRLARRHLVWPDISSDDYDDCDEYEDPQGTRD